MHSNFPYTPERSRGGPLIHLSEAEGTTPPVKNTGPLEKSKQLGPALSESLGNHFLSLLDGPAGSE